MDYRMYFDRDYIQACDLSGKEITVTISRIEAGVLTGQGGRKTKKPIAHFEGKERGLGLNRTNCKTIAAMYGSDTSKWIGKRITMYPTFTQFGGDTVDCIRVKPTIPTGGKKSEQQSELPAEVPADASAE